MKNTLIFLLLVSTFAFSQKKDSKKPIPKEITTEKFTWDTFKNRKAEPGFGPDDKTYIIGKKKIRVISDKDKIIVDESRTDSHYKTQKVYNAKTKLLMAYSKNFSYCSIGIYKEYDSNGKLKAERNFDTEYPFSLDDLIAKTKGMGIDITNNPQLHFINRYIEKGKPPTYSIMVRDTPDAMKIRSIEINGITGEIISDKIGYMEE